MNEFTMIVIDSTFNKVFQVNNVTLVPHIGDHIHDFGYSPAPKVTEVIWEYKEQRVTVQCK